MRKPLNERMNEWTRFEMLLFNLITQDGDKKIPGYFTNRVKVTDAMLKAYDKAIIELEMERI